MFKVVNDPDNPVVKTYMTILADACARTGLGCETVDYKSRNIGKDDIIVADSPIVSLHYLLRGYSNQVTWFQGIVPEESYLRNKSRIRFAALSIIDYIILSKSRYAFFVSEEMMRFYEKKYKLRLKQKCYIMPCFNECGVEPSSFKTEDKYTHNRFLYVGSLNEWQCFEETAELFAQLERSMHSPISLSVFTDEKDKAERILIRRGVINYSIDYVSPEDLPGRIGGMKYGFVLRKDIEVNRVATPTKLSNYLANGIIPIYSHCIGSFRRLDEELHIGVECNLGDIEQGVQLLARHMAQQIDGIDVMNKCVRAFDTYYNAERYTKEISEKLVRLFRCEDPVRKEQYCGE